MSAGRRIAYLSLETPKPGQASDTHVGEIAGELRRLGYAVELFATRRGGASGSSSYAARLADYARVQIALARRLPRFDVVYVRSHFAALPTAMMASLRGVPVVHEVNGKPNDVEVTYPALRRFAPLFRRLYRLQYRRAAALVAVTEGLMDWARTFAGHDRVLLVTNGANTDLFRPDGPAASMERHVVVFVGGLVAWHGIDTMLAALGEDDWPDEVDLLVVGDGVERDKIERCASTKLRWLGRRPYDEIPSLLRAATAALCVIENPGGRSSSGVAPLKLFEAMACGVPVIVSDLPFQADIVRARETGLVVPPGDPKALARAVASLVGRPEEAARLGRNGADYVARKASWRMRAEQLDALFEGLPQARGRWSGSS
ncbi:glycosyltransferase family 4 protein [Aureimonas leprariae]|uniref:glycosyltransferase family 4 protein n=1 Tax=Plantimonas leprariae TaxID=2615207 RepID=UPI001386FE10|nr:glycosyltransferase family 4 protein [Aureimonas leprariae]